MGKKESFNNSSKVVGKDIALAMAGLLSNPGAVIVTAASISVLFELGTKICSYYNEKKNKQVDDRKLIEQLKQLEPIRELDYSQKDKFISMAGKVFRDIKLEEGTNISVNVLLPEVKKIVGMEYPDTTEENYKILAQLVYYEIAWLELKNNPKEVVGYFLNENLDRKNENEKVNKKVDNIRGDVNDLKNNVDVIKDNVDVLNNRVDALGNGIQTEKKESKISRIIKEYADKYTETLYLHKNTEWDVKDVEKRVCLRNLYVEPEIVKASVEIIKRKMKTRRICLKCFVLTMTSL